MSDKDPCDSCDNPSNPDNDCPCGRRFCNECECECADAQDRFPPSIPDTRAEA